MMKHCILISGSTIALDTKLVTELQKIAAVVTNLDNSNVESFIENTQVDLILLEILNERHSEIEMTKTIKSRYPRVEIILINGEGNQDLIAKAFKYGARDAFRKPYKIALIVERVNAILRSKLKS